MPAQGPRLHGVVRLAVLDRRPHKEREHDGDGKNRLGDDQHFERDFHLSSVRLRLRVARCRLGALVRLSAALGGPVGYVVVVVVVPVVVVALFAAAFTGQATPELLLITRQPVVISLLPLRLRSIPRTLLATCA